MPNRVITAHQVGELMNMRKRITRFTEEFPCFLSIIDECKEPSISSHTISATHLRAISDNGEVVAPYLGVDYQTGESSFEAKCYGVRAASAFTGFCATHDKTLFEAVDRINFSSTCSNFSLLFMRALAQEMTKKLRNKIFFDSFFLSDPKLESVGYTETASLRTHLGFRDNLHDFQALWKTEDSKRNSLKFWSLHLECPSNFAAIGVINPEAFAAYFPNLSQYDGRIFRAVLFLAIPNQDGLSVTFAWFSDSQTLARSIMDRMLMAKQNLFEFFVQFALEHCEETFFRPSYWNSLDDDLRKAAENLMAANIDGLPVDLIKRPLKHMGKLAAYRFKRVHSNSHWAKTRYSRVRLS